MEKCIMTVSAGYPGKNNRSLNEQYTRNFYLILSQKINISVNSTQTK